MPSLPFRTLLLAALVVGTFPSSVASATPARGAAVAGRVETDFSEGWRFHYGAADTTVTGATFDDSGWERVSVPHTWNRMGAYATIRPATTDNRQGVAWYRLNVKAPASRPGQRQYLDFAGVSRIAEVWVNGIRTGAHRGAYTRFRFDVTDAWKPGAGNLIAVRADNSKPEPGSSTAEVVPLQGDFFVFGGIYRGVKLITTGPAGFDLLDHGGPGVYARATSVDGSRASVEILSRLRNAAGTARRLTATATVTDARGRQVARSTAPVTLAASSTGEVRQTVAIAQPHLWNGRADPYLYTVVVTLSDGARAVDRVAQPLGLRTFRFDADKGFFLNGRHLPLYGVSRHQDTLQKGYALSDADHAADMAMIADLGANTVRGAHYPHADTWYDLSDRYGMVMWAEVPYIQASSFDSTNGTPATFANAKEQMVELIRQQYNHPSIMMWSAGNEVDASALQLHNGKTARGLAMLQATTAVGKAEDPSRPTVFADCCEDSPFSMKGQQELSGVTDLNGYNRYYGWYYGTPADYGKEVDKLHAKHPTTPISISEYGAGGALTQHTDNVLGGPISAFGRIQPEEYESWYHEEAYRRLKTKPYLYATWVWNMFDFASDMRNEGDAVDLNTKGLVSYDRGTKKDAFYYYQANWSDAPMIHLNGRRYVERGYAVTDVRAYTNAERASLSLNGRPVGEVACPDHVCAWKAVTLAPGANRVQVSARAKGKAVIDEVRWNAPNMGDGLFLRAGTLIGGVAADGRRFGSDNWFEGGSAVELNPVIPGMKMTPKAVAGTSDPWMFESYRSGTSRYLLPVPDGQWTLVVHSFEPSVEAAATRTFGIKVDGRQVVDAFNPSSVAGGVLKAAEQRIPISVRGGHVTIDFVKQGGEPLIAAIEIRR